MFSTIVHPTDFSEASIPALKTSHALAKQLGAKLKICFIANAPMVADGVKLTDPTTNETRDIAEELSAHQEEVPGVSRELRLLLTDKATNVKTLLGFLEDMDCNLLVMGMHNKKGIAGWLRRSITEEVVRHAKCAVMVVKHDDYDFTSDSDDHS